MINQRSFMFKSILMISGFIVFFSSCKIEPAPINYGQDQCNFCKMNIVDKAHSAQYVSNKGKQFKYDAIECLVREYSRLENPDIAISLVANYNDPGQMIDAQSAFYIISPNIKSPMGANLSAVQKEEIANQIIEEYSGQVYNWAGLQEKLLSK